MVCCQSTSHPQRSAFRPDSLPTITQAPRFHTLQTIFAADPRPRSWGVSHLFERRRWFPAGSPAAIVRGAGALVWYFYGNEFIDRSMGLTSVSIGHGYGPGRAKRLVPRRCRGRASSGRRSWTKRRSRFLVMVDAGDMVKFAKNGSSVTTAAVKLSRAFTGRTRVALCLDHNFFSFDDWFIATTPCDRGIPAHTRSLAVGFSYNDIASVESLFADPAHDIACLIMEPVKFDPPNDHFLHRVSALCKKHGVVFILDEMITGFKWSIRGAQDYLNCWIPPGGRASPTVSRAAR